MAEIIEMPRLSDTMEEGVIAAWHKKVGEDVSIGDLLAEIETDKATMDFESPSDGKLLYIGVDEGNGIPVGALLAIVGADGEDVDGLVSQFKSNGAAGAPAAKEEAPAVQESTPAPLAEVPSLSPVTPPAVVAVGDDRIKASPLAKAMAKEKGIDLKTVSGTGDNGRIVKRDIENYKAPAAKQIAASAPAMIGDSFEDKSLSQMRKTIARRLSESKFSAPHFYLTMEINMDKAVTTRKALNEISPNKISFNDMIIKAAAVALKQHPAVNSSWMEDHIRTNYHVNIGMAVAVDEGLLVPVIRNADTKGLSTIALESRDLAGKAREKKLDPSAWSGNTFTISNLGMFGIEEFTAIINPPDSCILAVGAIAKVAVVEDGEIKVGNRMKVTMSCDHRVVDGATGSQFLVTLKELLEDPMRMLI